MRWRDDCKGWRQNLFHENHQDMRNSHYQRVIVQNWMDPEDLNKKRVLIEEIECERLHLQIQIELVSLYLGIDCLRYYLQLNWYSVGVQYWLEFLIHLALEIVFDDHMVRYLGE